MKKKTAQTLKKMRDNPQADWKAADIKKVCGQLDDLDFNPPTRGSHYKVTSLYVSGHLTIPYHRPIKPYYIKAFVSFVDAHLEYERQEQENGDNQGP